MKNIWVIGIIFTFLLVLSCTSTEDKQVSVVGALVKEVPNITYEQKEPEIGCAFNNPSCTVNQTCTNNTCVLKEGCTYDNPFCTENQTCTENQCIQKDGCAYENPPCKGGLACIENKCILAVGCNWKNPACNATTMCKNNECIPKPGCQNNNPPCLFGQVCMKNKCVGTATAVVGDIQKNEHWAQLPTVQESGVELGKQKD